MFCSSLCMKEGKFCLVKYHIVFDKTRILKNFLEKCLTWKIADQITSFIILDRHYQQKVHEGLHQKPILLVVIITGGNSRLDAYRTDIFTQLYFISEFETSNLRNVSFAEIFHKFRQTQVCNVIDNLLKKNRFFCFRRNRSIQVTRNTFQY